MIASEHGVFRATLSVLPETASFMGNFCKLHGIGSTDALRLTLIVEELFTNAVAHGYGGECDGRTASGGGGAAGAGVALGAGSSLRHRKERPSTGSNQLCALQHRAVKKLKHALRGGRKTVAAGIRFGVSECAAW